MPKPEQKEQIKQARREVNSELDEEMALLKEVQKRERGELKDKHHAQQENLILQKRKKFLEMKELILNE